MSKIYVASSWRNTYQPQAVEALRAAHHEVYDFRHPEPDNNGFRWASVDPTFTPDDCRLDAYYRAVGHPIACYSAALDVKALVHSDVVVLVLPAGNDAHLELGHGMGMGKRTYVWAPEPFRAGLMYVMATFMSHDLEDIISHLKGDWVKA